MERLFELVGYRELIEEGMQGCFKCDGYRELPSIEGIVQRASAKNYTVSDKKHHIMKLDIDTFKKGQLIIHLGDYRIDRGERVRLYSIKGFEKAHDDGNNFYVQGVQILDETGEVKFQSTYRNGVEFREQ